LLVDCTTNSLAGNISLWLNMAVELCQGNQCLPILLWGFQR